MNKCYLAYGSNLNKNSMQYRCPDAKMLGKAVLRDYRLTSRGSLGASYFTVEPCKGDFVPIGVWTISEKDEASLDFYEGYPGLYRKEYIDIDVNCFDGDKKTVKGLIYIMTGDRPEVVPSVMYIDTCKVGYWDFGLDTDKLKEVVERLEKK